MGAVSAWARKMSVKEEREKGPHNGGFHPWLRGEGGTFHTGHGGAPPGRVEWRGVEGQGGHGRANGWQTHI